MAEKNGSDLSRRDFLAWLAAAAAAMALPGCTPYVAPQAYSPPTNSRVRPAMNTAYASPVVTEPVVVQPQVQYVYVQQPAPAPAPALAPAPAPSIARAPAGGKVNAMSRNSWGATPAVPTKMKRMNGVSRITIHHEGSAKPNNDTTPQQVAATLRLIQSQHRKRMGAGDIGYHFIIDRTGTIWQGRDWAYQGAHTSGANSNNMGIMLLGNFEIQQPTAQQLASLRSLAASLVRKYGLDPRKDIYGHSDFCNTKCPGRHLKPQVQALRRSI